MKFSRNGKIARLPAAIREELNRRLLDGEIAGDLIPWLHSMPQVLAVLGREFGGRPIRAQNISEWRKDGYREWLQQQEAAEAVQRFNEEASDARGLGEITENAARWLVTRYIAAIKKMECEGKGLDWKVMREFCSDLVALRRGDHSSTRLLMKSRREATRESMPGVLEEKRD